MNQPRHLALLCDSGPGIGSGHLVRQLSVAQAWRRTVGPVTLTTPGNLSNWLRDAYRDAGVQLQPEVPTDTAVLLVDSYRVDLDQLQVSRQNSLLVLTDDFHQLANHPCDVLLDHNPGVDERTYPNRDPQTDLLLGATYTMVRPEFVAERTRRSGVPRTSSALRVLVTLGGDPTLLSLSRLQAEIVDLVPGVELLVADGTISDMASFMSQADLAVSASGSTIYELCVLGIPSIVIPIVDNQRGLARTLDDLGAAIASTLADAAVDLADLALDESRQSQLCEQSRRLIDGRGAQRIVDELAGLI